MSSRILKMVIFIFYFMILISCNNNAENKDLYLLVDQTDSLITIKDDRRIYIFPSEKSLLSKKVHDSIEKGLRSPIVTNKKGEVVFELENPWITIQLQDVVKTLNKEALDTLNLIDRKDFLSLKSSNTNKLYILLKNENYYKVYNTYIDAEQ